MGRVLKFDMYLKDTKVGRVELNGLTVEKNECYVDLSNYPYPFLIYPFCRIKSAIGIWDFVLERVVPKERANIDEILEAFGMKEYDAYELVRKTHGVMCDDFWWFKFDDVPDDGKTWDDLNMRGFYA